MNLFNKFYKFGSDVKPKASLYSLALVLFISVANLFNGIVYVKILTLLECFFIALVIALIEYFLFNNYDELSKEKKTSNTIIWAILTNIIVITSSVIFNLFPPLPLWGYIILIAVLEISLIAMKYSIYVVNLSDTEDLNNKLKKYQKNR